MGVCEGGNGGMTLATANDVMPVEACKVLRANGAPQGVRPLRWARPVGTGWFELVRKEAVDSDVYAEDIDAYCHIGEVFIMSHCCGARINTDTCICSDCKDHARAIVVDENGEEVTLAQPDNEWVLQ